MPEPVTPYHVATKAFQRAMATNHSIQAMFETLAHLNFLEAEGRAISAIDDKGVLRFAPPGSVFPGKIVQYGRPDVFRQGLMDCRVRPASTAA